MIPASYIRRLGPLLEELKQRFDQNDRSGVAKDSTAMNPDETVLDSVFQTLVERLSRNYPFHHHRYAGQMLKPPHPAAWLAYALSMTVNPNNHALDGGPEASVMEKEVMERLTAWTGFPAGSLGHLTSSGTIANLEALWVARQLHPDRPVAISSLSHYTHRRMCGILNHPVVEVPSGDDGFPDPSLLDPAAPLPGTLVVTLGTTGQGRVEPLHTLVRWAEEKGVRIHVDAAYGGFYYLLRKSGLIDPEPWEALPRADSLVIDPHKHGLQPYGCGSVLFRDPSAGRFYHHDSPYTYFTSDERHLGEISLECSRAGSAAVALWLTMELLSAEGLRSMLSDCRKAALKLHEGLMENDLFQSLMQPELDIVTFVPRAKSSRCSEISMLSKKILKIGMQTDQLYLSTMDLDSQQVWRSLPGLEVDQEHVTVLRSVLMKPEHLSFVPEMLDRLNMLYRQADRT